LPAVMSYNGYPMFILHTGVVPTTETKIHYFPIKWRWRTKIYYNGNLEQFQNQMQKRRNIGRIDTT